VATAAEYLKIAWIVGSAQPAGDFMMDFQKPGVRATGPLAFVAGGGQNLPPNSRGDGGSIAFAGSAGLAVAFSPF